MPNATIFVKDWIECLKQCQSCSVQMGVSSPYYYGLRDYSAEGQGGLEETPELYVKTLVEGFREFRRVLKDDGILFVNIGDSHYNYRPGKYADGRRNTLQKNASHNRGLPTNSPKRKTKLVGFKEKDLMMIPALFAIAMRLDGWYLRSDIIWYKKAPYPESVCDRPTRSHEHIFMFTKSPKYYCDLEAVKQPTVDGKSMRRLHDVWIILPSKFKGGHFATYPDELPRRCILMGSKVGDIVYDMFSGAGTTAKVALELGRDFIGSELNPDNAEMSKNRILESSPDSTVEMM